MQNIKKVIELLSKKNCPRISVFDNNGNGELDSILDTKNGTLFSVTRNSLYVFKDANNNFWSTVPKSFIYNNEKYHPKVGDQHIRKDGVKYSFTTKEVILEMAFLYFEKFSNPYQGVKVVFEKKFVHKHKKIQCEIVLQKFQSQMHNKMDTFISFN